MNKKIKNTLLVFAILFVCVFAYGFFVSIWWDIKTPPDDGVNEDTKEERLKDPNLLFGYFFWSGMCRNDYGEEGGCYSETYLYLNGKYIVKQGWTGLNDKKEIEPTVKKQLDDSIVDKVRTEIINSGLMAKDCPSVFKTDAGWDYFINLDGEKKYFNDPPELCWGALKDINEIIDSAQAPVNEIDYSKE